MIEDRVLHKASSLELKELLKHFGSTVNQIELWPELRLTQDWLVLNKDFERDFIWILTSTAAFDGFVYFFHDTELWFVNRCFIANLIGLAPLPPNEDI